MPIYERGSTFLLSIGSGKDRIRKAYKTREEAELAERRYNLVREGVIEASELPQEPSRGSAKGSTPRNTLGAAYKLTIKDHWSQRKSGSGIKAGSRVVRHLGEHTPVSEITTAIIREMVEEWEDAGNSGSTINQKLSSLSMMLKTAADEGWIETLPRIARRSNGTHRIRWMDFEEELTVLNACDHLGLSALKDYIVVAIDTGFRRGELIDFEVKNYFDGRLHLYPDETKTSKARAVPATDRVHDIIEKRSRTVRLFNDLNKYSLREHWATLREHLGKLDDPQFVVHMLRHTCASRLAMQDKTAQFIQEWMGHATPLTTARYMHLAPAKLLEGKGALEDYRKQNQPRLRAVNM